MENRLFLGEIEHGEQIDPGEHEAIVPRDLWDRVQAQLQSDHQGRKDGLTIDTPSLPVGLLQDAEGNRLTPTHTTKKGRRYRYYVSHRTSASDGSSVKTVRLSAYEVEKQVQLRVQAFLRASKEIID